MTDLYPMPVQTSTAIDQDANLRQVSEILQEIIAGATLKDIYGIPDDILEAVYAHAYNFYQKGNMAHAEELFQFLCMHDMYNTKYIFGLASVHHQKKNHAKAAQLFTMCAILEETNYPAMFYAGQCNLALKDMAQANMCFNYLVERDAPSVLKNQAQAYLAALVKAKE